MKRRELRALARKEKVAFQPNYQRPVTREPFATNNKYHWKITEVAQEVQV